MANVTLDTMQHWMQAVIMAKGDDDEAIESKEATAWLQPEQARQFILPSRTLGAVERLHIYRRMYILRFCEVLQSDFEAFSDYVGEEKFEELVTDYVSIYPSTSYSLNPLSYRFPEFLRSRSDLKRKEFLVELAELELAISQVFDMPQSPLLTSEEITSVAPDRWGDVLLKPITALRLLEFQYPVNDYLNAFRSGDSPPKMGKKKTYVLVYRPKYSMRREPMSRDAYTLLKEILSGKTLEEAVESSIEQGIGSKRLEQKLFDWFKDWVSSGIFSTLEYRGR